MMTLLEEKLIPYVGVGDIKLLSSLFDVKTFLKRNNINFTTDFQSNKGCNPEVPWIILHIANNITLSFANDKLWSIYCEEKFAGSLPNGIKIGMTMDEAMKIDSSLEFDELNEDYKSSLGYWLEDDLDTNTVMSITIFIKEVLNNDQFFNYKW